MPIIVRAATELDAAAIGEAHAESWRIAYQPLFSPEFLAKAVEDRRAMWPTVFASEGFSYTTLLVAEDETGVFAFAHFGPTADPEGAAEIYGFYAHPRGWGSDAATMLMRKAIEELKAAGFTRSVLWAHQGAERAQRFYSKSGWHLTGRRDERQVGGASEYSVVVEFAKDL